MTNQLSAECPPAPMASPAVSHRAYLWGTAFGLFASVGYTAANVCLRAVAHCNPIWVSAVKAVPTVMLVSPWLLVHYARGERVVPTGRVVAILAASGLLAQLGGNVLFQWSLGVVGLALAVPLTLSTIILAGALLGRSLLGEPITPRTLASMVTLILAISLLSLGAHDAYRSVAETGTNSSPTGWAQSGTENLPAWGSVLLVLAGVGAALVSGLAYAVLGVAIRYGVTGRASLSFTLVTTASTGVLSLGALALWRMGWETLCGTDAAQLATMLLAGVCNAIAFVALTRALQLTTVAYANALNTTQAAMAAVAGIVFFQEAQSGELLLGVVLTVVGLLLMRRRH